MGGIRRGVAAVESRMRGWPDRWLTIWLVVAAFFLLYVAYTASPLQKAAVAAWVTFP